MSKFRKKPVIIEAVQFVPGVVINDQWLLDAVLSKVLHTDTHGVYVRTLEGVMEVKPYSWIIKGVKGELYPCDDEIFKMTYEEVDE